MLKTRQAEDEMDQFALRAGPVIGSKNLWHDAKWSRPAVSEIETALLRCAAFPEFARETGLNHEFIVLDPACRDDHPAHEDIIERIVAVAERLGINTVALGNIASRRFGENGFPVSPYDIAGLPAEESSAAVSAIRERIGWVFAGSRFTDNRHILIPQFDATMLAIVLELLSNLKPEARPFVHLATRVDATAFENREHLGRFDRFGRAIQLLNTERQRIFVYGWSRSVASRLGLQLGIGVQTLDMPPDLSMATDPQEMPGQFTVGYFSSCRPEAGFERIAPIIRATNEASGNGSRVRFKVQMKPQQDGSFSDFASAQRTTLEAFRDRNVTIIDAFLPRDGYLSAIQQVDAVLITQPSGPSRLEQVSMTALHATAAGKLVLCLDDVALTGMAKSRVLRARDPEAMAEVINELAQDLPAVRTAAKVARSSYTSTTKPARLFAQLLYGPLIMANAAGHQAI